MLPSSYSFWTAESKRANCPLPPAFDRAISKTFSRIWLHWPRRLTFFASLGIMSSNSAWSWKQKSKMWHHIIYIGVCLIHRTGSTGHFSPSGDPSPHNCLWHTRVPATIGTVSSKHSCGYPDRCSCQALLLAQVANNSLQKYNALVVGRAFTHNILGGYTVSRQLLSETQKRTS